MNLNQIVRSVLLTCLSLYIQSVSAEVFTLDSAINSALKKHSKIHQYEERIAAKKNDLKFAFGNYLPSLNLSGSVNKINEPLTFNLDPVRDAIITLEANDLVQMESIKSKVNGGSYIATNTPAYSAYYNAAVAGLDAKIPHFIDTLKEEEYPSIAVTMVQPVFSGFKITAGHKAARADLDASLNELDKTKNDLIKEIATHYVNLIVEENAIQIRKDVLSGMLQHLNKATILSDNGMISKNNVLRAKVAVAEAQRNLDFELNRDELITFTIKKVCGINDSLQFKINDQISYNPINDSVTYFIELAHNNHPQLKMIKNNYTMAKQKHIAARSALFPQVNAFGKYEFLSDYLSAMEPQWIVGVQANLSLFNGGKNIASIKSTNHLVNEVEQIELSAKRDITLLVNKSYRDMRNSENRYLRLDTDIELANENLYQCKSRFESGYGTSLEIIDAELVLEKNKMERLIALGEYYKSIIELYTAAGTPMNSVKLITGRVDK